VEEAIILIALRINPKLNTVAKIFGESFVANNIKTDMQLMKRLSIVIFNAPL
jgi:hypothetical protein